MRKIFRDLLHQYRVESYKITHTPDHVETTAAEIMKSTEEALNNSYHYHFKDDQEPDPQTVASFNRIKNFTIEAVLPPVIQKVMGRVMVLEKQHEEMVNLIDSLLEALSEESAEADSSTV